jgi:hypothetical protein
MALFASGRDARLVKSINRELLHDFIQLEVAYYKLSLPETETNIYGESNKKAYYQPIRVFCLVSKEDKASADTDIGLDFTKNAVFSFLRDDLLERNIFIEVGDIIEYDAKYYEIDNVKNQQYWMGRNPETLLADVKGEIPEHGYSISVIAEAHMTKVSNLNIVEVRSGINTVNTQTKKIWNNL